MVVGSTGNVVVGLGRDVPVEAGVRPLGEAVAVVVGGRAVGEGAGSPTVHAASAAVR